MLSNVPGQCVRAHAMPCTIHVVNFTTVMRLCWMAWLTWREFIQQGFVSSHEPSTSRFRGQKQGEAGTQKSRDVLLLALKKQLPCFAEGDEAGDGRQPLRADNDPQSTVSKNWIPPTTQKWVFPPDSPGKTSAQLTPCILPRETLSRGCRSPRRALAHWNSEMLNLCGFQLLT